MRIGVDVSDLIETDRHDVLSVSLDVDPTKPEHQDVNPAYRIWLRNALRDLLDGLPRPARKEAAPAVERVLTHVEADRPRGRGMVIFASADLWREHTLPFPLPNRVRFGRPDMVPLLWAMDEYDPYAILAVDREHARILVAYLGRTVVVEEDTLELDTSDWRFKAGRQPTVTKAAGVGTSRGAQRDTFVSRVDEQVRRFWQGVATAAAHWVVDLQIERLIIGGPPEAASALRDLLPDAVRARVVGIVHLPSHADLRQIQERTLPVALDEEHRREAELVERVLDRAAAAGGGTVGLAASLQALIQEQVMTLVVDRDLERDVWRCTNCGYVRPTVADRCPLCGGAMEELPLPQVLPLLARRSGARLELVGGEAATRLRAHEGIGALLRYVPAAV